MLKKEFQHLLKKENQIGKINKMENIETVLKNSKTIAMIGVSSLKKKRRPKKSKKKAINYSYEIYARFWIQSNSSKPFCKR